MQTIEIILNHLADLPQRRRFVLIFRRSANAPCTYICSEHGLFQRLIEQSRTLMYVSRLEMSLRLIVTIRPRVRKRGSAESLYHAMVVQQVQNACRLAIVKRCGSCIPTVLGLGCAVGMHTAAKRSGAALVAQSGLLLCIGRVPMLR